MGSQNLCQQRKLQQLGFERCLPGWMRGASSIKRLPEGGNATDAVLKTVSLVPDPQSLPSFVDVNHQEMSGVYHSKPSKTPGVRQFLGEAMNSVIAKVQVSCMTYETLVTVYGVGCPTKTAGKT